MEIQLPFHFDHDCPYGNWYS